MGISYSEIMSRKKDILLRSTGIDYEKFEKSPIAFDYEALKQYLKNILHDEYYIKPALERPH